jgi:hypothetical protein
VSVLIFALVLAASLSVAGAPPVLPPETTDGVDQSNSTPPDPSAPTEAPPIDATPPSATPPNATPPSATPPSATPPELPPSDSARTSLPPGLEPVPFPLDEQRRTEPPPLDGGEPTLAPPQPPKRRSIVDLRDPFDRPPPRPRAEGEDTTRLLMPDLKDPFAPGLRRVRSQRLDMYVPNDIRDPFRDRPRVDGLHPPCARTTGDGTVVQQPGSGSDQDCHPSMIDLRDPFAR